MFKQLSDLSEDLIFYLQPSFVPNSEKFIRNRISFIVGVQLMNTLKCTLI